MKHLSGGVNKTNNNNNSNNDSSWEVIDDCCVSRLKCRVFFEADAEAKVAATN